jgi:CBS domain-containing protein
MQDTLPHPHSHAADVERALVERFLAAYNRIDQHLRTKLKRNQFPAFMDLVAEYLSSHSGFRARKDDFRTFAEIRNMLTHDFNGVHRITPSEATVNTIEHLTQQLLNPEVILQHHRRKVIKVDVNTKLTTPLKRVKELDITLFPTYDQKKFVGVINANGLAHWFATHPNSKASEASAGDVLMTQPEKNNYHFIKRNTITADAFDLFTMNPNYDALLITEHGLPTEGLLGIITLWDVAQTRKRI